MKFYIILGNGFTIDFINHFSQIDKNIFNKIDVKNLFRLGDQVNIPTENRKGLLSYRSCPALWMLGARPSNTDQEATTLIEEVITCANMFSDFIGTKTDDAKLKLKESIKDKIYLQAYSELVLYLIHLFSHYNEAISDTDLEEFINTSDWGWITFFKALKENNHEATFITYNYDIWLERIFKILNIEFSIHGFDISSKTINIIKPHGSISFTTKNEHYPYTFVNNNIFEEASFEQLRLSYDNLTNNVKGAIIPPAGDSARLQSAWSNLLRKQAQEQAKTISPSDEVILCGMSYWHVDRRELDSILTSLPQDTNFTFINPHPPRELNAVLVTMFKQYTAYSSAKNIGDIIHGRHLR